MTTIQWLFHYLEICKHQKKEIEIDIEKVKAGNRDIHRDLKYLMIVSEPERGKKAVDLIEEIERKEYEASNGGTTETQAGADNSNEPNALNKEDQELWDFMMSTPETKALPEQAKKVRDYVVEAKSLADVAEDLGLIGINDTLDKEDTNEVANEDGLGDSKSGRQPMVVQGIGTSELEEMTLGFEIE